MLIGKSSKWSSRGSDGRTRNGFPIFALRLRRCSGYLDTDSSPMMVGAIGSF